MDPDIAPLAQRLAEENNVDWRTLSGTGTDGRIVERDVLDYLAKVMAGEADIDPTPEPLPDGMDAWTDDEGRPIDAPRAAGGTDAQQGESRSAPAGPSGAVEDADEDLLLAGDDLLVGNDDALAEGVTEAEAGAPNLFASEPPQGRAEVSHDAADGAPASPDLFVDGDDEAADLASTSDAIFDFGGLPGDEARQEPAHEPDEELEDTFEFGDPEAASGAARMRSEGGQAGVQSVAAEAQADEAQADEAQAQESHSYDPPADEPAFEAPAFEAPTREAPTHEPPAYEEEESVPEHVAPLPTPRGEPREEPRVEPVIVHPSAASERWPLARTRTVLRRNVDLDAVVALQRSVSLEAGREHVSSVAVLLRAARFAAARLAFERPAVAYPDGEGAIAALVPTAEGLAGLATEIDAALRDRVARNDESDLWVADLSGLGLDDAVLDSDVPQLLLGRTVVDAEDDSSYATLSLASDLPVDRAAAFLERVAELLEDPLRLLA